MSTTYVGAPVAPPSGQPTTPEGTPTTGVPSVSPGEQLPITGHDGMVTWLAIVALGAILVGLVIFGMARRNRA